MGCFGFLKTKPKSRKERGKSGSEALAVSATTTSSSNYETSRSHDSTGGKQTSKSSVSTSSQPSISAMFEEKAGVLRVFELAELRSATNDFNRTLKIGEGGFGSVYKGFIKPLDEKSGRITVAVKTLNQRSLQVGGYLNISGEKSIVLAMEGKKGIVRRGSGHKQWLAEVQFLGVLEHPNLVKLIGYCSDEDERGIQRLLVYEYMPNKSLEYHLFNRAAPPLPWNVRLKIALGAAEGLAFLHEGLELQLVDYIYGILMQHSFSLKFSSGQVIYRDFKTSNVLLDIDFKPKLSDFGLAREGPAGDNTHVSTAVVGTYGYAAPDYIETGHLTTKSDVWSFGVVLYELLTGRRSLDRNRPTNEQKLLDWVKQFPIESKRFNMIMDPKLRYQYSLKTAREVAKLANSCLVKHAKERPKMSEIVQVIKQAVEMTEIASGGKVEAKEENSAVADLDKGKRPESSNC
ncbi:putative receptor-like protein kinase [Dendrobium catenatum]|uniref:Putative receptor-like protein kinase n=1 Tax=Dendrobium catenatum TaxID=906689 RepID=A0A2I0WIJ6_9ASPA|nr:putative receptor-like protein kinase [Dendrobium catenatum]